MATMMMIMTMMMAMATMNDEADDGGGDDDDDADDDDDEDDHDNDFDDHNDDDDDDGDADDNDDTDETFLTRCHVANCPSNHTHTAMRMAGRTRSNEARGRHNTLQQGHGPSVTSIFLPQKMCQQLGPPNSAYGGPVAP